MLFQSPPLLDLAAWVATASIKGAVLIVASGARVPDMSARTERFADGPFAFGVAGVTCGATYDLDC
jgi:hypothetical protein